MKKQAVFEIIKEIPLFSALTQNEIETLIKSADIIKFSTGDEIPNGKQISVVLKGSVAVTKKLGDKNLLMRMFGAGNVSGVASLFSPQSVSVSTLTALKPSEILIIKQETVSELIHRNGSFAMSYISFLTSRIRFLNSRIKAYTVSGVEAKLALHLLMSDESEKNVIDLQISFSKLADMLDIGRASLYRAIDSLTAKGVILKEGKRIVILKRSELVHLSDGHHEA